MKNCAFSLWRKFKLYIACTFWAALRSNCPPCLTEIVIKLIKYARLLQKTMTIHNKSYDIYKSSCTGLISCVLQ